MGVIGQFLSMVFGGGRNAIAETAEVFRVNAENADARAADVQVAALGQLAQEFAQPRKGWFDRTIDALNRVPRPAMALGTLGLFIAALVDPIWFAERMQGVALVPEPMWWLLGAIVSFYFGARHQAKGQDFQREIAASMARVPQMIRNVEELRNLDAPAAVEDNPALAAWKTEAG